MLFSCPLISSPLPTRLLPSPLGVIGDEARAAGCCNGCPWGYTLFYSILWIKGWNAIFSRDKAPHKGAASGSQWPHLRPTSLTSYLLQHRNFSFNFLRSLPHITKHTAGWASSLIPAVWCVVCGLRWVERFLKPLLYQNLTVWSAPIKHHAIMWERGSEDMNNCVVCKMTHFILPLKGFLCELQIMSHKWCFMLWMYDFIWFASELI